jgi:hypothetical protein
MQREGAAAAAAVRALHTTPWEARAESKVSGHNALTASA